MSGKLTDTSIAAATLKPGQKLTDGHSLYIIGRPDGAKQWRVRIKGSDQVLGVHPTMLVEAARAAADAKRGQKSAAAAPAPIPVAVAAVVNGSPSPTFGEVAADWCTFDKTLDKDTLKNRRLKADYLCHDLGAFPLAALTPTQARMSLQRIAVDNGASTADRAGQYGSMICDHAQRFDVFHNPFARRKGWLAPFKVTHHEAVTDPDKFGWMMEQVDMWESPFGPVVSNAIRFAMRVVVRRENIVKARWDEMRDLGKPELARWELPAERMKGGKRAHIVPLSRQAVAILEAARRSRPESPYCFPHRDYDHSPMGLDNLNRVFQVIGYAPTAKRVREAEKAGLPRPPTLQTCHGIKTCFRTLTGEALNPEHPHRAPGDKAVIRLCMAHANRDKVDDAYDRTERLPERRALMCWWADEIERLENGYKVPTSGEQS